VVASSFVFFGSFHIRPLTLIILFSQLMVYTWKRALVLTTRQRIPTI